MSRRTSITLIAVVLLAGSGKSYAQSDMDDVKATVAAYHAALSALDTPKMEAPLGARQQRDGHRSLR
jgi:hypothetical protein